ncbi:MAG TPA: hypothetical protein VK742_04180 [Candidatus Sulfotelmatobacter sp.]|nr:hypothetical protein [Candidatus Sulfotelmatobacter sp.]
MLNKLRLVILLAGLVLPLTLSAQTGTNTVIAAVAAEESLELLMPDEIPNTGTFWLVANGLRGNLTPPLPCPPLGFNGYNIYLIADGSYLVDETTNDASVMSADAITNQATPILNLIDIVQRDVFNQEFRMAMGMDVPSPGDGGGDGEGGDYSPMYGGGTPINTNQLWLEITNVSNGWSYLNLHHGTNQVYAIWTTTNLLTPWQVETELWPTAQKTNVMPFTIPTQGRQDLFVRAEDWTGVTENGNTTPSWWFWAYFGTTDLWDTNLDDVGNSLLFDYTYGFDPNIIQFSVQFPGYVDSSPAYGTMDLIGGEPAYMAVLVNNTNVADAVWQPYSTNVMANLTAGDGTYTVMVGLQGAAPNATPSWAEATLTLNTVMPAIIVTNPAAGTVWQPVVQLQGLVTKPLASLSYDISNATGVFSNQAGYITSQIYSTNLIATGACFQCYDLALTNGINAITLHATDIFGNTVATNISLTLNTNSITHPPALTMVWPTNDTVVAGTNFMLQGMLDDATATVTVSEGASNYPAMLERNGRFSTANLPLSGTNLLTVSATNVAGYGVSQTLTLIQGAVTATIDPLPASQLAQEFVTVTGSVSDTNHDVYINGVKATVSGDPTWSANNVPVLDNQGSGQMTVNLYPGGSNPGVTPPSASQQILVALQPLVQAVSYQEQFLSQDYRYVFYYPAIFDAIYNTKLTRQWTNHIGGASTEICSDSDDPTFTINLTWPAYWPDGADVNGTSGAPGYPPSGYSTFTPSTWGNASMNASGPIPVDFPYDDATGYRQMSCKAATDVQPIAGGSALSGAYQLIRLVVSAAGYSDNGLVNWAGYYNTYPYTGFEAPGDMPIPASEINLLNQPVTPTTTNANVGEKYVLIPAGGVHDLPVSVTGTNSNNYSFKVQPVPGLSIYDANSGQDLTLQTNTVIVGQQMNLICKTVSTNGPTLNNFQWRVPGFAISNYVVAADGSSAMVVTNFATNNGNVMFYWVDGATNRVVQCSATVEGKIITAQTTFNVVRPVASVSAITSSAQVGTNYDTATNLVVSFGTLNGQPGISFRALITMPPGMAYNWGDTNSSTEWVQLIYPPDLETVTTGDGVSHFEYETNTTLDTQYPYNDTNNPDENNFESDSPASPDLENSDYAASDSISAKMWLMFKPDDGNWVPLRTVTWNYSASATNNGTAWILTGSSWTTNPPDADAGVTYPTWTSNVTNLDAQWNPPF